MLTHSMPTQKDPSTDGEVALARATLYRLVAQAFRHPDEGWQAEWDDAARGAGTALEVLASEASAILRAPGSGIAGLCGAFDLVWAASRDLERIRRDHARLVGHSPRAGATPYETEWTGAAGEILQYHLLADLAGFYRAFGLDRAQTCDERQDHLSIELCFLGFLCVREGAAEERGVAEIVQLVRDAQRRFLDEHVLRWARSFCARTRKDDPDGFYGRAAALLEQLLEAERARFGLAGEESFRELRASSLALEDCCVGCEHSRGCAGPATYARDGARGG
jgi:DMSO reductase family type II enzyme chaperone